MQSDNHKYKVKIVFYALLGFYLLFAHGLHAATLSVLPSSSRVAVGNIVSVRVTTNTSGKSINNAEATVQFSPDLLEVVSVSKSSSIFTLWVEEPVFSNYDGTISFNGGVANPGFNGSGGSVATITFRAKKVGTASVIFRDGAIRENDGLGTDVLTVKNSATIVISTATEAPIAPSAPVNVNTPSKPIVLSNTHPDQDFWYALDTASFNWTVPSGISSIQAILNKTANATPTITYDTSVTQKTLSDLSDGTFYFHIRYSNSSGWGQTAHYKINVDTTAPLGFTPVVRSEENQNFLKLNARDAISGISHYTLRIDGGEIIKINKSELIKEEYLLPVLKQGTHKVVVTAYDKAGNNVAAETEFESSFVSVPTISLSSNEIEKGDSVTIYGQSVYVGQEVQVTLELGNKILKQYTQKVSSDGTFRITTDRIKNVGTISIWGENIFESGVKSNSSAKLYLKVSETPVVMVTFALFWLVMVIALFTVLLFILYMGWHKFFGLKRKVDKELERIAIESHKAMILFKQELHNQLNVLEKTKVDRTLNKKEEEIFSDIQKNVDDIDTFIEKKLKKLM